MLLPRCHLQRLPTFRIIRTNEVNKGVLYKNPGTSNFCAREPAQFGSLSDFFAMHVQECARLREIEGNHVKCLVEVKKLATSDMRHSSWRLFLPDS